MKKRILCVLLSAVLFLSLLPVGAIPAMAASGFTASDECIDLLKSFEGFSAKPYWDYSQYTVGYGTKCPDEDYERYMDEGISEEEAEALLRTYVDAMGEGINSFIEKYGLSLSQNQFDALLLFSYNCGTGWLYQSGTFRSAVISGATGNEFLYAIALWCNAGGSILEGLIRRRLAEANLYLNGVYSATAPSNYCYVLYNANGGAASPRIQAYDSDLTAEPIPTPTYDGYSFDGWYTAVSGGNKVTVLDASVRNRTVYAHWNADEESNEPEEPETPEETESPSVEPVTGTPVNYYREITVSTMNVMESPSVNSNVLDAVKQGEVVSIVAEYTDSDSVKWGQIQNSGWIQLQNTKESTGQTSTESGSETSAVTVKVTANKVNLREGPGTNYTVVGSADTGKELTITATASGSGYTWGQFNGGWIALKYTNYDSVVNGSSGNTASSGTTSVMGTVTAMSGLRIRSGAGTAYSILGFLSYGTRVEILEQKAVSGMTWGKISSGWISLDYVKLDNVSAQAPAESATPETPTEPETPATPETPTVPEESPETTTPTTPEAPSAGSTSGETVTGKVVNTTSLRIRSGPGTNYSVVGYLSGGTEVTITERTTSASMVWGKISSGWISLDYVELDSASENATPIETGIVTVSSFLRVRTGPSTTYAIAGYLYNGDKVEILEKRTGSDGMVWGKVSSGWISLSYVKLDSNGTSSSGSGSSGSSSTPASSQTKTVTADCLRIRSAAGTSNSIVGYLYQGAKVTILETTTVSGMTWGRIEKGWISMDYVK